MLWNNDRRVDVSKSTSFSPLQSELYPCDRQCLYVKRYNGHLLGHVEFLHWLPPISMGSLVITTVAKNNVSISCRFVCYAILKTFKTRYHNVYILSCNWQQCIIDVINMLKYGNAEYQTDNSLYKSFLRKTDDIIWHLFLWPY